jgi:hypothetical protein
LPVANKPKDKALFPINFLSNFILIHDNNSSNLIAVISTEAIKAVIKSILNEISYKITTKNRG